MNKKNKNIKPIINRRIEILRKIIYISFIILTISIINIIIFKNEYYSNLLESLTKDEYSYKTSPRGRIYDRNYNILADNKKVEIIAYLKPSNITAKEEIENAKKIAETIEVNYSKLTLRMLKDYWLIENNDISDNLIMEEEWKKYENRKLSNEDIYYLKISRINEEMFKDYKEIDKETAYIYYLMNNGYFYEEKTIKKENITELEIAKIAENTKNIKGFYISYEWERVYPYGDTFRTILGNVSTISKEDKEYYLNKGYELNEIVGISFIEKQYEEYLRGTKGKYKIIEDKIVTTTPSKRGNDIVLTIDIKLQQEIDKILIEELKRAKSNLNTEYFNQAYVVIKEPNTGEILAMSGKQVLKVNKEYKVYDVTVGVITNAITPGSVVKGASILVGYNEGAIKIGEKQKDECIKLYSKPKKCSWSTLGYIDDITALSLSSNIYQFKTAMKVAGYNYKYNGKFENTEEAFKKYRKMFNSLGLGVKTEIDLPVDGIGNVGNKTDSDLLLNYVIGQYDTYTTMQLSEYISTIAANGNRYKPHLLKEIYESSGNENLGILIYKEVPKIINTIDTNPEYLKRVQTGFKEVMTTGLGKNYMGIVPNPAGKTGTSESFLDTNNDGVIDTPTLTNAFVGYYPYENPKMSIAIAFPNIVNSHTYNTRSYANMRITRLISNKFFELYG